MALRQQCTYSYLSPVRKILEPHNNIQIDNYFIFLERDVSPLRLEVLPNFKPKTIQNFNEVIEDTILLIYQNDYVHEFHKNKYKLPYSLLYSDITSRNIIKNVNNLIKEKLNQIKRRLPIPLLIKRGFE